jgi:hypothetical protein
VRGAENNILHRILNLQNDALLPTVALHCINVIITGSTLIMPKPMFAESNGNDGKSSYN